MQQGYLLNLSRDRGGYFGRVTRFLYPHSGFWVRGVLAAFLCFIYYTTGIALELAVFYGGICVYKLQLRLGAWVPAGVPGLLPLVEETWRPVRGVCVDIVRVGPIARYARDDGLNCDSDGTKIVDQKWRGGNRWAKCPHLNARPIWRPIFASSRPIHYVRKPWRDSPAYLMQQHIQVVSGLKLKACMNEKLGQIAPGNHWGIRG